MSARFAPVRRGHYDTIVVLFVSFLLLSNIGATKLIELNLFGGELIFDGGAILFPLTYVLGDVISEVYGFKPARKAIILGLVVSIIASAVFYLVQIAPPAADYENQAAFEAVLGFVPRIVLASVAGYVVGQLLNSWVLVKLKQKYGEKNLWVRLLGSTVVGEAADTAIFCLVAWAGVMPASTIFNLMIVGYIYKVAVEFLLLPITYWVVAWVKKNEPAYEEIQ
ncbi:VUT family protein [Flaviflexus ciconiae]|uniref:Probable queuosine precursor transporter n=1 Tax=Flaviflexus ciconiae TaxID=2496867 RepID=A0A3Q9G2Q0_9ACTO|nr:queuosine precursor transporter [Flaviflexus ciconiae]AZQ77595.1 VUT family protein [Flaviflexus ciconiae]